MAEREFWRLTPREFGHALEAFTERDRADRERAVAIAWKTAAYAAQAFFGKLPDLDKELQKLNEPAPAVGHVSQAALVTAWSQAMGIKPRPISDAAQRALGLTKES